MSNKKNKDEKFRFIPRIIRYDFFRKMIALFFALLLWRSVDSQLSEHETLRDIPINVSLSNNMQCMSINPTNVTLKVKASRYALNKLSSADIEVNIKNLDESIVNENAQVVQYKIDIRHDITLPSGITVLQVKPEKITINVEKRVSKTVPVKLVYSGFLMSGYSYNENRLIPKQVIITGPKGIVDEIKYIETEPVILREVNVDDFECEVALSRKKGISISTPRVTAHIEIFKKLDVREFVNIEVKPFGAITGKGNIVITPNKVLIMVDGVKQSLEVMNGSNIHPYVDITAIKEPGKYSLDVKCWIDAKEVKVKEIIPSKVSVEFKKQ